MEEQNMENVGMETIGTKIANLRKANGMTQADLGTQLNVSYQAVSKWEREESCPDFDMLSRIAKIFNVPITYFESKAPAEEVATTVAVTPTEQPTQPAREMLGVCKDCGKVVYKGDEGNLSYVTALICKPCATSRETARRQKEEAAKREQQRRADEQRAKEAAKRASIARSRRRGIIWGIIIAVLFFVCTIVAGVKEKDYATAFGYSFAIALFTFTYVSQLFWDGFVLDCTLFGGKIVGTPGIIFTFDLDGFIFLIAMKILFALLRMFIWLITFCASALFAILVSPFTFFPALHRVNSGDLED